MTNKRELKITNLKKSVFNSLNAIQTLGVFIVMMVFLSIAFPSFFTVLNLTNIIKQQIPNLLVAIGITIVLINGEIDISIGGNLALVSIVTAKLILAWGILPGVIFGILTGTIVGLFNKNTTVSW